MNYTSEQSQSKLSLYLFSVLMVAFGVFCLYLAISISIDLYVDLSNKNNLITFDKGSLYLYGVGLTVLTIIFWIFLTIKSRNKLPGKLNKLLTIIFIASFLLTFTLPQIVHATLNSYLENQN